MKSRWCLVIGVTIVASACCNKTRRSTETSHPGPMTAAPFPKPQNETPSTTGSVGLPPRSIARDIVVFPGPSLKDSGAPSIEPSLRILLHPNFSNDESIREDFAIVARQVSKVVQGVFEGASMSDKRPVVRFLGGPLLQTLSTHDSANIWVRIALTSEDVEQRNYCRFAYQLSHEFGHLYLDPRRSNGLIETLADAVSYRAMREMSVSWSREGARNPELEKYAAYFVTYRELKVGEKLERLPIEIQELTKSGYWAALASYLEEHIQELDHEPYCEMGLSLRGLAAVAFEPDAPCKELIGLAGSTNPRPSQDGRYLYGLATDLSEAPPKVRQALLRIGRR